MSPIIGDTKYRSVTPWERNRKDETTPTNGGRRRKQRTQGVTDHCFVSSNWTFCPVIWLFGSVHLRGFCVNSLKKVVVIVSRDNDSSLRTCSPASTGSTRRNCRIYPLNWVTKSEKSSNFVCFFQKFPSPNLQYFSKNLQIRHRIWLPKVQFFFKSGQK